MKVFLYTAISSASEAAPSPVFATPAGRVRARLARLRDQIEWRAFGRFRFAHYNYAERLNTNVGDVAIRLALRQELTRALAPEPLQFVELAWGELDPHTVARVNAEGGLFVVGGSGYFHHDARGALNRQPRLDAPLLAQLRCPVAAIGIGINCGVPKGQTAPADSFDPESEVIVRSALSSFSLCTVRDERTRRILSALSPNPVVLSGDPALFLDSPRSTPPSSPLRVGINFGFHGPLSEALLAANFRIYAEALRAFRARTSCQFLYFQHSDGERLIHRLLASAGVPSTLVSGDPIHLLEHYSTLSMHCCQMLHSAILATNAGIPSLNISYDLKNRSFYELFELPRFSLDPYSLTSASLLDALLQLHAQQRDIRPALAGRRDLLLAGFRSALARLAR